MENPQKEFMKDSQFRNFLKISRINPGRFLKELLNDLVVNPGGFLNMVLEEIQQNPFEKSMNKRIDEFQKELLQQSENDLLLESQKKFP